MTNPVGRPLKFNTPEELQEKIDEYFYDCEMKKRPLTIAGLAFALDVDSRTIRYYEERDEFFPTIKRAKQIILVQKEELLTMKNTQIAGLIFDLKNNYGDLFKEKVENDVVGGLTVNIIQKKFDNDGT
jgi:hypothetical protein